MDFCTEVIENPDVYANTPKGEQSCSKDRLSHASGTSKFNDVFGQYFMKCHEYTTERKEQMKRYLKFKREELSQLNEIRKHETYNPKCTVTFKQIQQLLHFPKQVLTPVALRSGNLFGKYAEKVEDCRRSDHTVGSRAVHYGKVTEQSKSEEATFALCDLKYGRKVLTAEIYKSAVRK